MNEQPNGNLIIIGGHEEKQGDCAILKAVAQHARDGNGALTVVTVATQLPEEVGAEYQDLFKRLGVKQIEILDIRTREQAYAEDNVAKIAKASVIFFTGGDQLRITSQVGDSLVFRCMRQVYQKGGMIVGTSAGAAAMPETMLIGGASDSSNRISALSMAPGLAFIADVVIDSHFAERGRMGRLLGAVAQNPRNLGLGIDENTAIIVRGSHFEVIGSGAVYIVDGTEISYSSLSEQNPEGVVSIDDVTIHVLGAADHFDLKQRQPIRAELECTR